MRALAAFLALLVLVVVVPAFTHEEHDQFGSGSRAKEHVPFTASPSPGEHALVGLNFELVHATRPLKPKLKRVQRAFSWDLLAACESHGNWSTNTGNGYYGGLQEDLTFWATYGPHRFDENGNDLGLVAPRPDLASRAEQIAAAERARAKRGLRPWPTCARKLGWL